MGERYLESHMGFQLMGANYTLSPIFSKNRWVQLELSQNRWVQLHPLTQPNDAPVKYAHSNLLIACSTLIKFISIC